MAQAWFRYYREAITDPKFTRLSAGQRHLWTVLLCLSDDRGHIAIAAGVPYDTDELAQLAGTTTDETRAAIEWLELVKCISVDDSGIIINNWNKRQFKSDDSTERVRQHRMKRYSNVSVTPPETETETDTDTSQEGATAPTPAKKRKVFTPPTVAEVDEYRCSLNARMDPNAFVDYYTAKGWLVGKATMKDWKAAVRNWIRREQERSPRGTAGAGYTGMTSDY